MRSLRVQALSLSVVGALLTGAALAQVNPAQPQQKAEAALKPAKRFDGKVGIRSKEGKRIQIHVLMRNFVIRPGEKVSRFPEKNLMLVQLVAGKAKTVIDGRRETRKGGDFWTVAAGSAMSIEVTSESATLQTVAISR